MASTEAVSAKLTMHLKASTGYSADCSATISPAQWGDLNAIVSRKPTRRERALVNALQRLADKVEACGGYPGFRDELTAARAALHLASAQ